MAWKVLCKLSELPADSDKNAARECVVEGKVIAIFRRGNEFYAVDGMCAHQGGPLAQGHLDGQCLTCPWHGWQYDISSGENLLTNKKMLETYEVEVRDDEVWIKLEE